jgi:hypothetical protein
MIGFEVVVKWIKGVSMTHREAGLYPAEMGMLEVLKAESVRVGNEASRLEHGSGLAIHYLETYVQQLMALSPEVSIADAKAVNYIFENLQIALGLVEERKNGVISGSF